MSGTRKSWRGRPLLQITPLGARIRRGKEDAEDDPRRRCIQLAVPGDSDLCRAIVRRLVRKAVRAPGPQSERVHEQVCPCLSAEARTGLAR